ncbi:MAG: hypothetical protein M0P13_08245 [Fibrobacteraceae bacterium]|nr:hypothetical protein [Fibrobacteraceae bacterium]
MNKFIAVAFCFSLSFGDLPKGVEQNFIKSCVVGSDSVLCSCVFGKVQKKYSPKEFDAIELTLSKGKQDSAYSDFLNSAVKSCNVELNSGSAAGALAGISGNKTDAQGGYTASPDEKAFVQGLLSVVLTSPEYKKMFRTECAAELVSFFGLNQANASCDCAYQKLLKDNDGALVMSLLDESSGKLNGSLTIELFIPCLPKTYPPEMKKMLLDTCVTSAPRPVCDCMLKDLEKTLTLEQLVRKSMMDPSFLEGYVTGAVLKCQDK